MNIPETAEHGREKSGTRFTLAWVLLLSILPLLGWWTYGLLDLDEGFYAAITAEMNRRGEWITPFYNGSPWFEKPILLYWFAKPSLMLFGEMIGPRLPSILATFGTYALVGIYLRKRWNLPASVLAVFALSSSLLVVGAGRMMLTDPLLVFALTAGFISFWESIVGDRRWRLVTAAMLGIGVLTKGPVVGILFALVAGWTYARQPSLRPAFRGWWLAGTAILVLLVSSWYVPAYLVNGRMFVDKFLIEQNIGRFSGGDQAHTIGGVQGLVFYFAVLLVGFTPWLFFLRDRRTPTVEVTPMERYLVAWALTVFIFFTISGAKLVHYILPMFPPMAMLLGIRNSWRVAKLQWVGVGWLLFVAGFAQWGFASYYGGSRTLGLPGFHAEVHQIARYVRENAKPGDIVAVYQMSRREHELGTGKPKIQETSHPSLLLYLNRTVVDTDDLGALAFSNHRIWVITRYSRVNQADVDALSGRLHPVNTPFSQDLYRLYMVEAARSEPAPLGATVRPNAVH